MDNQESRNIDDFVEDDASPKFNPDRFMSASAAHEAYGKAICDYYGDGGISAEEHAKREEELDQEMPDWMFAKEQF